MTFRPARVLTTLALLALPVAAMSACTTARLEPIRLDAPAIADASVAGPAIDISNLRGNITLRVDPRAERISVKPTIRLDKDGPAHFDLDLVESSIDVAAEVQDRGGLPALAITTTSTSDPAGFYVDLDVRMPSAEGVRVRSAGGTVRLENVRGAIDVESVSGPIEVRTEHALVQPVSLSTGAGDVFLVVSPRTTGRVTMRSYGGKCYLESLSPDARVLNTVVTENSLTSSINGGTNPVDLRTTDGAARMWILERPLDRLAVKAFPFAH